MYKCKKKVNESFQIVMVVSGFDYEAGSQGGGGVVLDEIDYNARLCTVGRYLCAVGTPLDFLLKTHARHTVS